MALYLGKINSQWKVGVLGIVCSFPVEKCGGETGGGLENEPHKDKYYVVPPW